MVAASACTWHRAERPQIHPEGCDETQAAPPNAAEKFVQGNSAPSSGCSLYAASREFWGLACIPGAVPPGENTQLSDSEASVSAFKWAAWDGLANDRKDEMKLHPEWWCKSRPTTGCPSDAKGPIEACGARMTLWELNLAQGMKSGGKIVRGTGTGWLAQNRYFGLAATAIRVAAPRCRVQSVARLG